MTRVAVVGNSHLGAIKLGWEQVAARHPELQVEFFAAPGTHYYRLEMFEPRKFGLPPGSSSGTGERLDRLNGRRWIDLAAADVVVVVGREAGFNAAAGLLAEHDVDGLPEAGPELAPRRLSAAAFAAFADAIAARSGLVEHWRNWDRPRVHLLPRTRPAESALRGAATPELRPWRRLARSPEKLLAGIDSYVDRLEAEMAAEGVVLLRQPAASLSAHGLTRENMTRGSLRIDGDVGHGEDDVSHANAEYGALFWEAYASRLAGAPQPA